MAQRVKISIDIIAHATEDTDRITACAAEMFGIEPDAFDAQVSLGHFGNPITRLTCTISGRAALDVIATMVERLGQGMSEIRRDIGSRIEDSALYIRLDKQELVQKRFVLDGDRAVKVRISTVVYGRTDVAEVFADILQIHRD